MNAYITHIARRMKPAAFYRRVVTRLTKEKLIAMLRFASREPDPNLSIREKRRKATQTRTVERREARIAALSEDYAALRNDPETWQQELEERKLWDRTTRDGIGAE
jgi:hypothetical protein